MDDDEELEVRCTIELLGRPKGIAVDKLKEILKNLREGGKKLTVYEDNYSDEKEVGNGFFSAFANFKVRADLPSIFGFVLDYAPSSLELMNTSNVKISATDLQAALNDISGRLAEMDQAIKVFSAQKVLLEQEVKNLKGGKNATESKVSDKPKKDSAQ